MNKEKLNDIICESTSDYDILNDAYNYIENLEQKCKKQKEVIDKIKKLIKSKDNGTCFYNNKKRCAYTFVLNFDEARQFIWDLEDILNSIIL